MVIFWACIILILLYLAYACGKWSNESDICALQADNIKLSGQVQQLKADLIVQKLFGYPTSIPILHSMEDLEGIPWQEQKNT